MTCPVGIVLSSIIPIVGINKFNNYVNRVMELPADVDPSKITTRIVFNPDGTYSHVPTEVFQQDGKWYTRLNSLTNSNYSLIWNPVTVESVIHHWSKDATITREEAIMMLQRAMKLTKLLGTDLDRYEDYADYE